MHTGYNQIYNLFANNSSSYPYRMENSKFFDQSQEKIYVITSGFGTNQVQLFLKIKIKLPNTEQVSISPFLKTNIDKTLRDSTLVITKSPMKSARKLLGEIEKCFSQKQLEGVDFLLGEIDFRQYGVHSAIGIVKSTFRCKDMLLNWTQMFKNSKEYLEKEGYDPEEIFSNINIK